MQMCMEYFLPGNCFAIPSQVISIGLMCFVKEFLDRLNHKIYGLPFFQIQIKGSSAMTLGDNQARTDKDRFFSLQKMAMLILQHTFFFHSW